MTDIWGDELYRFLKPVVESCFKFVGTVFHNLEAIHTCLYKGKFANVGPYFWSMKIISLEVYLVYLVLYLCKLETVLRES